MDELASLEDPQGELPSSCLHGSMQPRRFCAAVLQTMWVAGLRTLMIISLSAALLCGSAEIVVGEGGGFGPLQEELASLPLAEEGLRVYRGPTWPRWRTRSCTLTWFRRRFSMGGRFLWLRLCVRPGRHCVGSCRISKTRVWRTRGIDCWVEATA
jgi:hypothetical protein